MAPDALEIVFPERSEKCSIIFGDKLLDELPLDNFSEASSVALITDDLVAKLYAHRVRENLSRVAKTHLIVMRHGEQNKNLASVAQIARKMSDAGLDRKSVILALGGGVVGDLTGFMASIFKRGISYFQFPTTLLAQVDSSIGGKCGVDATWGKNQLGTFYQPKGIFEDSSVLDSLPQKEIINGLGEIVKSGIIADRPMFDQIAASTEEYFSMEKLKTLVRRTCEIKAKVVERDEREMSVRKVLNYGHTIGHAIEASLNYKLSHGKCVVLGMICEGWIAAKLGIFQEDDFVRQNDLLFQIKKRYRISPSINRRRVLSFALLDKKNASGVINMSLPEEIGRMHPGKNGGYSISIPKDLLLKSLDNLKVS
jgi:3-dehydroquinate synthase